MHLLLCVVTAAVIYAVWLFSLIRFSVFWKNRIDIYGITLSKWCEQWLHYITQVLLDLRELLSDTVCNGVECSADIRVILKLDSIRGN